jgi:hypothetical protein
LWAQTVLRKADCPYLLRKFWPRTCDKPCVNEFSRICTLLSSVLAG